MAAKKFRVGTGHSFLSLMEALYNCEWVMYLSPRTNKWKPMHYGWLYSWHFSTLKIKQSQGRFARAIPQEPLDQRSKSERYIDEVKCLTEYFEGRLVKDDLKVQITQAQYQTGTDSLPGHIQLIVSDAIEEARDQRNYEPSYNQLCNAFFKAARNLNRLKVT